LDSTAVRLIVNIIIITSNSSNNSRNNSSNICSTSQMKSTQNTQLLIRTAACLLMALAGAAGQRISTARIGDNRYFISSQNPYAPMLNFHLAYQYCRSIAMELVSLETAEEAIALTEYLRVGAAPVDYWTAGNALGAHSWIWMSNGAPFNGTFNYWPNGQPAPVRSTPTGTGSNECMVVSDRAKTWKADNCNANHHFICEQTRCYFYNFNPLSTAPAPIGTR
jgi:hypothetical protein